MKLVITHWALDSYLDLKHSRCFTSDEFETIIRPDVLRLKNFNSEPKFNLQQFWCPVKISSNETISGGFKMKWDSMGNSNNEIRLLIAMIDNISYLCEGYFKKNSNYEYRKYIKFNDHVKLIRENRYIEKGIL